MNERLLLEAIRSRAGVSRAELARASGLAKNTVSLALANLERARLVRVSGVRTGVPGPAAVLYEVHPDAGFVLGLDVGRRYLRGAVADITGAVRARSTVKVHARTGTARVTALAGLADSLLATARVERSRLTQTVLGSPGVYDPRRDRLTLAGELPGWEKPDVLAALRRRFGSTLLIENDVDAAALAEQAHGHGRGIDNFVVVSVGTGIGMGVILGGRLYRGHHGAAGEIGFMPLDAPAGHACGTHPPAPGDGDQPGGYPAAPAGELSTWDPGRRHDLETLASASGVVRAARRGGHRGPISARRVFAAAERGETWARQVVTQEAVLVARAICTVVTVVDPELVILGGGIGRATGFAGTVAGYLRRLSPVVPEVKVSALGADAVVDGCLAAGTERAWRLLTSTTPGPTGRDRAGA